MWSLVRDDSFDLTVPPVDGCETRLVVEVTPGLASLLAELVVGFVGEEIVGLEAEVFVGAAGLLTPVEVIPVLAPNPVPAFKVSL